MKLCFRFATAAAIACLCPGPMRAADDVKSIAATVSSLRRLEDSERARTTKDLALRIRVLPASSDKLRLASNLAMVSTEGDPGQDVLQEVATTLSESLRQQPAREHSRPETGYQLLAQLVRYEDVRVDNDSPQLPAAMAILEEADRKRRAAGLQLADLQGRRWSLDELRGKVVLVNFWATWCPPCRKEMPDLQALYQRFQSQGLVVLAVSDEEAEKVKPFVAAQNLTFPVLLDPGRKANEAFAVDGIPKTFIYDRAGKLVAQAMDMRTMNQFLRLLAKAGLQ